MADLPISGLTAFTGTIPDTAVFAISSGGSTYKITGSQLKTFIVNSLNDDYGVIGVTQSGDIVTFQFSDPTDNVSITLPSGSSPSLKISGSSSAFLNELTTLSTIEPTTEFLVSDGVGSSKKVSFSAISSYLGSGGSSGSSVSIFRSNNAIITYTGTQPTVTKVAGKLTITCAAGTIILSVDHQISSPTDSNPSNSGYEVEFIYPTGTCQTLTYTGVISQCPIADTSIYTISGSSAQKDYVDASVVANTNGFTILFAEALTVSGAIRRLSIRF